MSIQKPSAFATGEGPQVGQAPSSTPPLGQHALGTGWSFTHGNVDSPPTPPSFAATHTSSLEMPVVHPHIGVPAAASMSTMSIPGTQPFSQSNINKRRITRHQSLPVPGDNFTSLVKRQEAARLRKISNGLSRSASASSASTMGAPHSSSIPGPSASSMKSSMAHAQHPHSSSSMLGCAQSSSQMSSLMQASIMQSSIMLTQMMNQRIASNNAALRHTQMPPGQHVKQVPHGATPVQMQQMPGLSMQIPTVPSVTPAGGSSHSTFSTMMPPRPATNMSMHTVQGKSVQQADKCNPATSTPFPQARAPAARPPLEPSARVAAELVVTLGAKMKEICEHQTVLVQQMQHMRQKIDEKDKIIRKLQEHERTDMADHVHERGHLSDELARLKEQMQAIQSLSDAAASATMQDGPIDGAAKQISELNMESGDTEEDCLTTKGDDLDGEEPSTASTSDGKPSSRPSSVTQSAGRYHFKPVSNSTRRKRRELDDLFRPKDSQHSTH